MLSSKVIVRPIVTAMIVSLGFVLYPGGSANAATHMYCAEPRGATATGQADCLYPSLHACRAHVKAAGGGHCYRMKM